MKRNPTALLLLALGLGTAALAHAGPADDVHGTWAGSHVEFDAGPPPAGAPSQAELDAWAVRLQLTIDASTLLLTNPAGERSHGYTLVGEDATTVTVETSLGAVFGSGGAPRTVVLELVGADALRLRLGAADGHDTVLIRQ